MNLCVFVLALVGPVSAIAACGYASERNIPAFTEATCPYDTTTHTYTTPDTANVLPQSGSTQITIYMRATLIHNCGELGDYYIYDLRKFSNDQSIISFVYDTAVSTYKIVSQTLTVLDNAVSSQIGMTALVTYVLTYDLATGKGFGALVTSSTQIFARSVSGSPSITSFDPDLTLYLCGTSTHMGFKCTINEFRMWPVYDENFVLSAMFGQSVNTLYLFEMKEMTGVTVANSYSVSTPATLATAGSTLPSWATKGIGIMFTDPNQYISIPGFTLQGSNTYARGSFTLTTWIKIPATPSTDGYIFKRTTSAGVLLMGITLSSDLKINVLLESTSPFSQKSNGAISLDIWTSITVTIVQTVSAWTVKTTSVAIVINNAFDQGRIFEQVSTAMTNYLISDLNMIGGAPNSLIGTFAHFKVFTPGTLAFSFPPCPVQLNSLADLGIGTTQSLVSICDPNCNSCFGPTTADCFSCAAGRVLVGSTCENLSKTESVEAFVLVTKIEVIALATLAGTTFLMQANPALLWTLVSFLQIFYYLTFINVTYPVNVEIFLELFQVASLDFIPNPIEKILSDVEKNSVPVPGKYEVHEIEGLFLINSCPILMTWGVYFVFYLFAIIAKKCIPGDSNTLHKYISKVVEWYQWSGLLGILIAAYPDIVQSAFLQVRALSFSSRLFSISSVLSLIFTLFGIGMPLLVSTIIYKNNNNLKQLTKKYEILVDKCNIKNTMPRYMSTIAVLRAMIVNGALVLLQDYPVVQVIFLLGPTLGIVLTFAIKRNVFASTLDNVVRILEEFFFTVLYINIFILSLTEDKYTEEERLRVGWVIIGCCIAIFSIFLGCSLYENFITLRELIRNYRRPPSKKEIPKKRRQRVETFKDITIQNDVSEVDMSISNTKAPLNLNTSFEASFDQFRYNKNKVLKASNQAQIRPQGNIETKSSIHKPQSGSNVGVKRKRTVVNVNDNQKIMELKSKFTDDGSKQTKIKKKRPIQSPIRNTNVIFRSEMFSYK